LEKLVSTKHKIPGTRLTFSEFFYGFMELGVAHFPTLWSNGLVCGWIKREQLQSLLEDQPVGTLFIRAALSVTGAVMSWKHSDGNVHSLEPWSDKNLQSVGLVKRVQELALNCSGISLEWIYPGIPLSELENPRFIARSLPPPPQDGQAIVIPYAKVELVPIGRLPEIQPVAALSGDKVY
jgi:hypothetical protein